jgi:hypothetical protein
MRKFAARGDVYYPLHCYSLSHLVPSLVIFEQVYEMQSASYLAYLADPNLRLVLYFLLGGMVTALTAYFSSLGRGMLSAFITTLPLQTILGFLIIYAEGGSKTVVEFAKSLLLFTPPWLCYVLIVLLGVNRIGLIKSLSLGVLIFVILSVLLQKTLPGTKL